MLETFSPKPQETVNRSLTRPLFRLLVFLRFFNFIHLTPVPEASQDLLRVDSNHGTLEYIIYKEP